MGLYWVLGLCVGRLIAAGAFAAGSDPLDRYNVVWNTPSTNSAGSMPLGNGDLAINLWVEQGGDLLFYISKTDAWDENARLVKLGRLRLQLTPNPFRNGAPFRQELRLRQGEIIVAGPNQESVRLTVWVDANHPVIQIQAQSDRPIDVRANLELWRTAERALVDGEEDGTDTAAPNVAPVVFPDRVLAKQQRNRVVWFHRNDSSLWQATLVHQGLGPLQSQFNDPLIHRTFGGSMMGAGFVNDGPTALRLEHPARRMRLSIFTLTAQSASVTAWKSDLDRTWEASAEYSPEDNRDAHRAWWDRFWNRSWIRVTSAEGRSDSSHPGAELGSRSEEDIVSQGYVLQRFINACAGRGAYPIKFNGSVFTVEIPGKFDPDYRRWGGCYWFQNTRLAYWPMLGSGDYDLLQPLFKMYREMLPFATARTRAYFGHDGAFFPETMHFWGAYHNGELGYGWEREGEPIGRPVNKYIRFYWSGGLELAALALDYWACTQDERFLNETALPLTTAVLAFYSHHYPREPRGTLLIVPAQSLETWWQTDNPLPEIAGLRWVLNLAMALPKHAVSKLARAEWEGLQKILPAIPTRQVDGEKVLAPGESFSNRQNMENPELYAVFPFRHFGVGREGIDAATRTFQRRSFKGNRGWQQDEIQAACLGLASEARRELVGRFGTKDGNSRFPAFWGPNFDWVPDQDHGNCGLITLQSMLLQWSGNKLFLFPAWPKAWDVEFKLHAPGQTIVEGTFRSGHLDRLEVTPPQRKADIIQFEPQ